MILELDDGYQFGLGAFETILLIDGRPIFLEEHLHRLNNSLKFFNIDKKIDTEDVLKKIQSDMENDTSISRYGVLKIIISDKNQVFSYRVNPYNQEKLDKGFNLEYSKVRRNETSPLTFHKSLNYGDNIMEKRRTLGTNIDEVIFLNTKGEISEGSTTNIFFIKDGIIATPPITAGILPGIMRSYVLKSFSVEERIIFPEEIKDMDECFVTNSLMGIMPVNELSGYFFQNRNIAENMQKKYSEILRKV